MLAKRLSQWHERGGPLPSTGILSAGLPSASPLRERGSIVPAAMIPALERLVTNTAIFMAGW